MGHGPHGLLDRRRRHRIFCYVQVQCPRHFQVPRAWVRYKTHPCQAPSQDLAVDVEVEALSRGPFEAHLKLRGFARISVVRAQLVSLQFLQERYELYFRAILQVARSREAIAGKCCVLAAEA